VEINDVKAGLISNLSRDRAEEYWACIRSFLGAKLTKYEFDCQVFHLLGPENVPLHNQFIKALLRNAYSAVPSFVAPAQPAGSLNFKREASDATATGPSKRLKTKAAATPGSSSIVRTRMPPRRPSPVVRQFGSDHLRLMQSLSGSTSPSSWALRNRMYKIAVESGLSDITPDAVSLLTHAMEHHLKDILAMCKRARKTSDLTTTSSSTPAASVFHQPEGDTITARDLLTMVHNRPYLLGEDLPVNQERILIMQEDY